MLRHKWFLFFFPAVLFFLLFFFVRPSHSDSLLSYRQEGREITQKLIYQLRQTKDYQQLIAGKNELKQKFNQLAKMMIAAHALYLQKGALSSYLFISEEEHILSEQLKAELDRLYQIEGCRQMLESCEEEALQSLAFHHTKNAGLQTE